MGSLQYRLAAFFALGIESVNASFLNTTSWQILVTSPVTRDVAFTDVLTACATDSFFRNYLVVAMSNITWSSAVSTNASHGGDSNVVRALPSAQRDHKILLLGDYLVPEIVAREPIPESLQQ